MRGDFDVDESVYPVGPSFVGTRVGLTNKATGETLREPVEVDALGAIAKTLLLDELYAEAARLNRAIRDAAKSPAGNHVPPEVALPEIKLYTSLPCS